MVSSSIKRQRRRRRIDEDGDPEFQVAPMVDVLLVLMLFFMSITSTEVLKKEKSLQLAEARHAKPDEKKVKTNELVVNVVWREANGNSTAGFSMDGIDYSTADAMQGVLAAQIKENPKAYVLIRADRDVQYSNISDLMNTCAAAGISTVTFAVITGGTTNKASAADRGGSASN
jgi:biopolymer transport protein ExbD